MKYNFRNAAKWLETSFAVKQDSHRPLRRRLNVEELEDRTAPSVTPLSPEAPPLDPTGFSYDAASQTLTVTGSNGPNLFTYSQSTAVDSSRTPHTTYKFTLNGVTVMYPDSQLVRVIVYGQGADNTAILITNDTYVDAYGVTQETPERVSLGSMADAGVGVISKFEGNDTNNSMYPFLTLSDFAVSYAYVGRNDGSVLLFGTAGAPYNGFVTAGNYSYLAGPGFFHEAQGASSVYGYSAGQATDFAYHYTANPGSAFVVSGTAFSYMSGTDQNPDANNATESFFNVGVGFTQNTGVSKNPGQDFAYIIDSPGNDTFVGETAYSYMYALNSNGAYAEYDAAYGFALVFAQSFVGGRDIAINFDTNHNILSGNWNRTSGGGSSTGGGSFTTGGGFNGGSGSGGGSGGGSARTPNMMGAPNAGAAKGGGIYLASGHLTVGTKRR
jgi:hypothetical protein